MSSSEIESLKSIFEQHESNVRSYCRDFPTVFSVARGSKLRDVCGREYVDLFAGAGALNYGHNDPRIIDQVCAYIADGGILHALDMYTDAKSRFIGTFHDVVLAPRGLNYKLQFPGPTGTNAVEAALKLARKVTKRRLVVSFSNGFHGMTLGALAATANPTKRAGAGIALDGVIFMPYEGFLPESIDSIEVISGMFRPGSGIEAPAAFIVETVQGEGGLNVASSEWLRRLASLVKELGALLIVDDVQAGIGRTGSFFSFEPYGLRPDIVVLSKSLSGFGLPMSLMLLDPYHDIWAPGEHNGTFRGNNLAFVGATAALDIYWRDSALECSVARKHLIVRDGLERIARMLPPEVARVKGRGLMMGLEFTVDGLATAISRRLFNAGYIVETSGHRGQVLKLLPPLTISDSELSQALAAIEDASITQYQTHVPVAKTAHS